MDRRCSNERTLFVNPMNDSLVIALYNANLVYSHIHGYICFTLCIIGVLTNVINVIVLTRRRMRTSINVMLTAIAICDIGTMLSYSVFVMRFHILRHIPFGTFEWMCYIVIHMFVSVVLHSSSMWYAVAVALTRKMIISLKSFHNTGWQSPKRAALIVANIGALVSLVSIPTLLTFQVQEYHDGNITTYNVDASTLAFQDNCVLLKSVLWIHGMLFKVIPCVLLLVLIISLITAIRKVKIRRKNLMNGASSITIRASSCSNLKTYCTKCDENNSQTNNCTFNCTTNCASNRTSNCAEQAVLNHTCEKDREIPPITRKYPRTTFSMSGMKSLSSRFLTNQRYGCERDANGNLICKIKHNYSTSNVFSHNNDTALDKSRQNSSVTFANSVVKGPPKRFQRHDHTTILLLLIVSLSLLTEIPQGIAVILTAIYSDVGQYLYPSIADMLDLLSLINSSVNFYLYCGMSSRYRKTVLEVLLPANLWETMIGNSKFLSKFPERSESRTNFERARDRLKNSRFSIPLLVYPHASSKRLNTVADGTNTLPQNSLHPDSPKDHPQLLTRKSCPGILNRKEYQKKGRKYSTGQIKYGNMSKKLRKLANRRRSEDIERVSFSNDNRTVDDSPPPFVQDPPAAATTVVTFDLDSTSELVES